MERASFRTMAPNAARLLQFFLSSVWGPVFPDLFDQPKHITNLFPQCLGSHDGQPASEFSGPIE